MEDYRTGLLASVMANLFVKDGHYTPQDFMPIAEREAEEEDTEEAEEDRQARLLACVETWNAALGGKDLRDGNHSNPVSQARS